MVTPNLSQITAPYHCCHCHQIFLNILSSTSFCLIYLQIPFFPTLSLVSIFHLSGHMQSVVLINKLQNYQNWVVGACLRQYGTWVSISSDLSWPAYIDTVCCKAKLQIGLLHRHFHAESPSSKAQLYKSLVLPILDYCSSLWYPN